MTSLEQEQLRILRIVGAEPEVSQRQLAERLGFSLGKANYLLRALLDKGYLKAGNFLRAEEKRRYVYLLTPEGMSAKLQLSRDYLVRKEREYMAMRLEIEAMRDDLATMTGAHTEFEGLARAPKAVKLPGEQPEGCR